MSGETDGGMGFQPGGPVVHGAGAARDELGMTRQELARAVSERDFLARELREILRIAQTYNYPLQGDLWKWMNEVGDIAGKALARIESVEMVVCEKKPLLSEPDRVPF